MACDCGGETRLAYACSGAANTGLLADRVMRVLVRDKVASGTCLAALGADLSGFVQSAASADANLVLDGCPVACGKRIFESKGLPYRHFVMTDFGVEKGKTPITEELVEKVAALVAAKVAD